MGQIWVREFTGGLDTRRLPEATSGATLIKAVDGHINRGGEFEQRAAFVPSFSLPAGTVGLAYDKTQIIVFGSAAAPALPVGVGYHRLQHPTNSNVSLKRVLSWDRFAGKIYAIGEFSDGSRFHFYDGVVDEDWFSSRARGSISVVSGQIAPGVAPTAKITSGAYGTTEHPLTVASIRINGVEVLKSAIPGSLSWVAKAINDADIPYSAVRYATSGGVAEHVIVTAEDKSAALNGKTVVVTRGSGYGTFSATPFAGGVDPLASKLTGLTVNGVELLASPIEWVSGDSATAFAARLATAVNNHVTTPQYVAIASGGVLTLVAGDAPPTGSGYVIHYTTAASLAMTGDGAVLTIPPSGSGLSYEPGQFVRTIKSKVYALADSVMHFSGVKSPTKWFTLTEKPDSGAAGAGFIDMATEAANSDALKAIAKYQQYIVVFGEEVAQIWYVDPDPTLNKVTQVLENTGTIAGRSVTQVGDADLYYLDVSGVRSLRARNASVSAATADIGIPVDTLINAKVAQLTSDEIARVIGLVEPRDGRFWLIVKDQVFVFSYFPGSKISAWTTYNLSYFDNTGASTPFAAEDAVVFRRRVYVRSGDNIFAYGGTGHDVEYDEVESEAWTPYLDGKDPARKKHLMGVDLAGRGNWQISLAVQPKAIDSSEVIARTNFTTYNGGMIPANGEASHVSLRFKRYKGGEKPAVVSSAIVHVQGDADAD